MPTVDASDLIAVVLCGGRSTRMGRDKRTLKHPSGLSYLNYSIAQLRPITEKIFLSASSSPDFDCAIDVIHDSVSGRGPVVGIAASVRCARELRCKACLVIPVDMPCLKSNHLKQLVNAWRNCRTDQVVCATTHNDDRPQPLVAIYPIGCLDAVEELADSDDRSLFRWLQRRGFLSVALPDKACHNVNHPDELL